MAGVDGAQVSANSAPLPQRIEEVSACLCCSRLSRSPIDTATTSGLPQPLSADTHLAKATVQPPSASLLLLSVLGTAAGPRHCQEDDDGEDLFDDNLTRDYVADPVLDAYEQNSDDDQTFSPATREQQRRYDTPRPPCAVVVCAYVWAALYHPPEDPKQVANASCTPASCSLTRPRLTEPSETCDAATTTRRSVQAAFRAPSSRRQTVGPLPGAPFVYSVMSCLLCHAMPDMSSRHVMPHHNHPPAQAVLCAMAVVTTAVASYLAAHRLRDRDAANVDVLVALEEERPRQRRRRAEIGDSAAETPDEDVSEPAT